MWRGGVGLADLFSALSVTHPVNQIEEPLPWNAGLEAFSFSEVCHQIAPRQLIQVAPTKTRVDTPYSSTSSTFDQTESIRAKSRQTNRLQ